MFAVPSMTVLFSPLMCFAGMLVRYFVNDFEVVSVARISTGMTFFFNIPHAL